MSEVQRILVVEDDIDTSEMLSAYFKAEGYEVLTAAWGEDALRITKEMVPSLVVLDIRLPDIDGYEVCRRLREQRRTEQVPIIFLTEHITVSLAVRAMRSGALNFLEKPIRQHEVWDAIHEAIDIDQRQRKVRRERERCRQAVEGLDRKEKEILEMLAVGRSKKAMAAELQVCIRTVEMKRTRLMKKLGLESLAELVQFAVIACDSFPVAGRAAGQRA